MKKVLIDKDTYIVPSSIDIEHCYTARIYDIIYKGERVCNAGIENRNGYYFMFMSGLLYRDNSFKVVRCAKKFIDILMSGVNVDIYAQIDDFEENAEKFLKMLGFKKYCNNILRLKK